MHLSGFWFAGFAFSDSPSSRALFHTFFVCRTGSGSILPPLPKEAITTRRSENNKTMRYSAKILVSVCDHQNNIQNLSRTFVNGWFCVGIRRACACALTAGRFLRTQYIRLSFGSVIVCEPQWRKHKQRVKNLNGENKTRIQRNSLSCVCRRRWTKVKPLFSFGVLLPLTGCGWAAAVCFYRGVHLRETRIQTICFFFFFFLLLPSSLVRCIKYCTFAKRSTDAENSVFSVHFQLSIGRM